MNTALRAVDPSGNEILCLSVATTPLHPGPLDSPYGNAHIIFWATVGLATFYWLIIGIARIVSAWGRGFSRPGPGIWQRFESAGFILASAISGERFATPALMRFCKHLHLFHVFGVLMVNQAPHLCVILSFTRSGAQH
jgi:hypothetical protein